MVNVLSVMGFVFQVQASSPGLEPGRARPDHLFTVLSQADSMLKQVVVLRHFQWTVLTLYDTSVLMMPCPISDQTIETLS